MGRARTGAPAVAGPTGDWQPPLYDPDGTVLITVGAEVTVAACDAADREELARLLASIPAVYPLTARSCMPRAHWPTASWTR